MLVSEVLSLVAELPIVDPPYLDILWLKSVETVRAHDPK